MNKLNFKVLLLFAFVVLVNINTMAQDIITLKNGDDIKAFVQDIGESDIKYKKFENPKGPNYMLKKSEILMIRYANGTKDIFKTEEKSIEEKVVSASEPVETKHTSTSEPEKLNDNENAETTKKTISLPESMQNRKDVIVALIGIQTRITHVGDRHIYYIKYKKNGSEKGKKINKKKVDYTLSWTEDAKAGKYPLQMDEQDFLKLPVYLDAQYNWTVFGVNKSNLQLLQTIHSDIYNDYKQGVKLFKTGQGLNTFFSILPPLLIPGMICTFKGQNKIANSLQKYYEKVDIETCAKYGIVITPYKMQMFNF